MTSILIDINNAGYLVVITIITEVDMKTTDLIIRFFLGAIFILFGLSKFYAFMPTPPITAEAAMFLGSIISTGYLWVLIGIIEVLGGALILSNKLSNVAIILLGPIVVNIVGYLVVLQLNIGWPPILMSLLLVSSFSFLIFRRRKIWLSLIIS